MKIRHIFSLYIFITIFILICSIFYIQYKNKQSSDFLKNQYLNQKKQTIFAILKLKNDYYFETVNQNACWSEMIKECYQHDSIWAVENIDYILSSTKTNNIWLLDSTGKCTYFVHDGQINLDISNILTQKHLNYFKKSNQINITYYSTPKGVIQLFIAGLFPSGFFYNEKGIIPQSNEVTEGIYDKNTKTFIPKGYLVIGKIWDSNHLNEISQMTGIQISYISEKDKSAKTDTLLTLSDQVTKTKIASLATTIDPKVISEYQSINRIKSIHIILALILLLILTIILLNTLVLKPLSKINQALKNKNIKSLRSFNKTKNEFGEIAENIRKSIIYESKAHQNQKKYQQIFSNMHDGFVFGKLVYDRSDNINDIRIIEMNEAFEKLFNISQPDNSSLLLSKILTSLTIKDIQEIVKNGTDKSNTEFQIEHLKKHLSIKSYIPFPYHIGLVIEDITAYKESLKSIAQKENLYKTLSENMSDMVCLVDDSLNIIHANLYTETFLKASREAITKKNLSNFLKPDSFALLKQVFHNQKKQTFNHPESDSSPITLELNFVRSDNTTRWGEIKLSLLSSPDNSYTCQIVTRDIEERKKIETQLIHSEQKYRDMLEWLPEMICESDLEGKIRYANRFAMQKTGYTSEDIKKGLTIFDLFIPEEKQKILENVKIRLETGKTHGNEYMAIKKDGSLYPCIVFTTIIKDGDKPTGMRGVMMDISKRVESENALKENLTLLNNSIATKDKLFSIIAHDLRNPMSSIFKLSELLNDPKNVLSENEKKSMIEMMNQSSSQAFQLLDNLLIWSKSERGLFTLHRENTLISELIKPILDLFKNTLLQKQIEFSSNIDPNTSMYIDREMISSVLRNLIGNSIKFTQKGGSISINYTQTSEHQIISVQDNGEGISDDVKNRIMHFNSHISTPGSEGESGSGLGLSICKEFIEKHNGNLWFESEYGKGSEFFFSIPFKPDVSSEE